MSTDQTPAGELLAPFLDSWLAQVPPSLALLAYHAALPHRFRLDFLQQILPPQWAPEPPATLPAQLARLQRAGFLTAGAEPDPVYTFQPDLRRHLLARWQVEDPAACRAANARAAAYLAEQGEGEAPDRVYHLLGAGEDEGLAALASAFEQGWARRQFGRLERLLAYAREQAPLLAPPRRLWLAYYGARLATAANRPEQAELLLRDLLAAGPEAKLQALAWIGLGELLLAGRQTAEALIAYRKAQALFADLSDPTGEARAWEALGTAFVDLASTLGGRAGPPDPHHRWRRAWETVAHAPFLLYRFLARRVAWLPNFYYGTEYQEWLIVRLLYQAIAAYEQAQAALQVAGREAGAGGENQPGATFALDLDIRLADLYHQLDQWLVAARHFRRAELALAASPDEYRLASFNQALGRAHMAHGRYEAAQQRLEAARATFARYGHRAAQAVAAEQLGTVHEAQGERQVAVARYQESARLARAVDDLLTATRVEGRLDTLSAPLSFPPEGDGKAPTGVEATAAGVDAATETGAGQPLPGAARAYVARFPGIYLRRFRLLAVGALLLTYFFVYLLAGQLTTLVAALEIIYQALPAGIAPLLDLAPALLTVAALPLLTIWGYQLLYVLAGWFFVRWLPLSGLTRWQAKYIVTLPGGIVIRHEDGREDRFAWADVTEALSVDRALATEPLALFSRQWLRGDAGAATLEGISSNYRLLQRDLRARLSAARRDFDLSVLASPWAVLALTLALLLTAVALFDLLDDPQAREVNVQSVTLADGTTYRLPLTSLVWEFYRWALYLLPLTALGRLLYQRVQLRAFPGLSLSRRTTAALALAFLLLLFWFLGELLVLTW